MKVYDKNGQFITRAERARLKAQKAKNIANCIILASLIALELTWYIIITN